ncbi:MAG: hypothetical protein WCI74_00510 [Actinomycetes bacterium]
MNGVSVHIWCGPGSVTVKIGGQTTVIAPAVCDMTLKDTFAVSAGTTVDKQGDAVKLPTTNGLSLFVQPVPASKDGTYSRAVLGANINGKQYVADSQAPKTVKISNGGKQGLFSGVDNSGTPFSGTFTCG